MFKTKVKPRRQFNAEVPKGPESAYGARGANEEEDIPLDFKAGQEVINAKKTEKQLSKLVSGFPPALLLVLSGLEGTEVLCSQKLWTEAQKRAKVEVEFPLIFEKLTLSRIAKLCSEILNNVMFIPEDIPADAEKAYVTKRAYALGRYTTKYALGNGREILEVDIKKIRVLRISHELMKQSVLFSLVARVQETKLKDEFGFTAKSNILTTDCRFVHENTDSDYYASPSLFPYTEDDQPANLITTFYRSSIPVITDSYQSCVNNYVLLKAPRLPKVPILEVPLENFDTWAGAADRPFDDAASFCKIAGTDGLYPIDKDRVLAGTLEHLACDGDTVGGKMGKLYKWITDFESKFGWYTSGGFIIPFRCRDKQRAVISNDDTAYRDASVLINPVEAREKIISFGAYLYAIPVSDAAVIDMVLRHAVGKQLQVYISMGPNPHIWLKLPNGEKYDLAGLNNAADVAYMIGALPIMCERLAFRNIELILRRLPVIHLYQICFDAGESDENGQFPDAQMNFVPCSIPLPRLCWMNQEDSSKKYKVAQQSSFVNWNRPPARYAAPGKPAASDVPNSPMPDAEQEN
jgi:hypothetical protein